MLPELRSWLEWRVDYVRRAALSLDRSDWRRLLLGDYDYKYLCTPEWPYSKIARAPPRVYGRDERLGVLVAVVMGLQHTLAMVGGLITPPLLVGLSSPDRAVREYLIQASLIVCGIMTAVQVTGIQIKQFRRQWGAGVLSVMGTSFASVPIVKSVVADIMAEGGDFNEAYGKVLGTLVWCALTPLILSALPHRTLKLLFPPVVCGVTIILMGVSLTGMGMKSWGGGTYCADNWQHTADPLPADKCQVWDDTAAAFVHRACWDTASAALCTDNGHIALPFGSALYVGMGFLVFSTILVVELFGSPFMRNCGVAVGLILGYVVALCVDVNGKSLVNLTPVAQAPTFSFLWTKTFPLGFYFPAVFPLVIVYCLTSVECVGDITATEEASGLDCEGYEHVQRIRGALVNDGVSGILSALAFSMPLTTFAQNNGVIALTAVASRWAGWSAAGWLVTLGLFGKFSALLLSVPSCVMGGMTTFLFANVMTSGIKIIMSQGFLTRRNRFILAAGLALGLGATLVPQWAGDALWPQTPGASAAARGVRSAVLLVMQTGFCVGALTAFALNLIMPKETKATASVRNIERLGSGNLLNAASLDRLKASFLVQGVHYSLDDDGKDNSGGDDDDMLLRSDEEAELLAHLSTLSDDQLAARAAAAAASAGAYLPPHLPPLHTSYQPPVPVVVSEDSAGPYAVPVPVPGPVSGPPQSPFPHVLHPSAAPDTAYGGFS